MSENRLQREWLTDKEFSCWISGFPGDEFVYCKLCQKDVSVRGKSSLRAHANGMKHSDLERAFKRKRKKPSKPASSSHSSAPVRGDTGTQTAGFNINLINAPSSSTVPDVRQNVSSLDRIMRNISSRGIHQSSNAHLLGPLATRARSPSVSFSSNDSSLLSITSNEIKICNLVKQALIQMLARQKLMIENDISDFLNLYKEFLDSNRYSIFKSVLENYKSDSKRLRSNVNEALLDCLSRH